MSGGWIGFSQSAGSGGGGGEANTASNASSDGAALGVFFQKVGVDLQFNGLATKGNLVLSVLNGTTHTIELSDAIPIQRFWGGFV